MPERKTPVEVEWQGDAEGTFALLVMVAAVRDGRLGCRRADGTGAPFTPEDVARDPGGFEFQRDDLAALVATVRETLEASSGDLEGRFAALDMLAGLTHGEA